MMKTAPAVFAVGNDYQIMVQLEKESLFWVNINGRNYYDESNGIMNSLSEIHRVTVPMKVLEAAGSYTVCIKPIIDRKPYFPETADTVETSFEFHRVPDSGIRAYHISDAHNRIEEPLRAARAFGDIDILILNGDVIDHSGDPTKFSNIYEICSAITGGSIPVVFSRGNHDMRGRYAERFADYTPNRFGNTYYTFRLGGIWGLLVDAGEDKRDDCDEYGCTVACHAFRERQTDFIESVIENAEREYNAPGVKTRIVIAHHPFMMIHPAPFDIEEEFFTRWTELLANEVKPELIICGHLHETEVLHPASEEDAGKFLNTEVPCPVVIGAKPGEGYFCGCGFIFNDGGAEVVFTDSDGKTLSSEHIEY